MKTVKKILLSRWGLLMVGLVLFLVFLIVQQVQSEEDPPFGLPTPILTPFPSNNTATPDDTQFVFSGTPLPTDMPFVVSKKIDLSPELTEAEEIFIYVRKNTGEIILYFVGPVPPGDNFTIPQTIMDKLPLERDDVIVTWASPSPMRRHIPTLPVYPTIIPAYPYPPVNPTINLAYP